MSGFIIIMYTKVHSQADQQLITQVIADFDCVREWSLDLDDSDRVLRLLTVKNIGNELLNSFKLQGLQVSLTEVFDQEMIAGS